MAYITNLQHFDGVLDPGSKAPAPARRLAQFLTDIVRVASREAPAMRVSTDVKCFKRPGHRACPGRITARRSEGEDAVTWQCPSCGENGVVSGWMGTSADLTHIAREDRRASTPSAKATSPSNSVIGWWRITWMDVWDMKALSLMGPPFLEFERERDGSFGFIAVGGGLDWEAVTRDGKPGVEFSWEGDDDGEPRCGRGWATLSEDDELVGRFCFHLGDSSDFRAVRDNGKAMRREPAPEPPRRARRSGYRKW